MSHGDDIKFPAGPVQDLDVPLDLERRRSSINLRRSQSAQSSFKLSIASFKLVPPMSHPTTTAVNNNDENGMAAAAFPGAGGRSSINFTSNEDASANKHTFLDDEYIVLTGNEPVTESGQTTAAAAAAGSGDGGDGGGGGGGGSTGDAEFNQAISALTGVANADTTATVGSSNQYDSSHHAFTTLSGGSGGQAAVAATDDDVDEDSLMSHLEGGARDMHSLSVAEVGLMVYVIIIGIQQVTLVLTEQFNQLSLLLDMLVARTQRTLASISNSVL